MVTIKNCKFEAKAPKNLVAVWRELAEAANVNAEALRVNAEAIIAISNNIGSHGPVALLNIESSPHKESVEFVKDVKVAESAEDIKDD